MTAVSAGGWGTSVPMIIAQGLEDVSDTQKLALGTMVRAVHPSLGAGEFFYGKGVASCVLGSVCLLNQESAAVSLATANDVGKLGVAMGAIVANKFGFFQVRGKAAGKVLAAFADNADCYLTSTAGSVDDTDVAGDFIRGMKGASAIDTPSTGLAYLELNYPEVYDGKDN